MLRLVHSSPPSHTAPPPPSSKKGEAYIKTMLALDKAMPVIYGVLVSLTLAEATAASVAIAFLGLSTIAFRRGLGEGSVSALITSAVSFMLFLGSMIYLMGNGWMTLCVLFSAFMALEANTQAIVFLREGDRQRTVQAFARQLGTITPDVGHACQIVAAYVNVEGDAAMSEARTIARRSRREIPLPIGGAVLHFTSNNEIDNLGLDEFKTYLVDGPTSLSTFLKLIALKIIAGFTVGLVIELAF